VVCVVSYYIRGTMSLLRRLMNRNMSLYDQLDALAACGIVLREGAGTAELLRRHPEREYETSPFKLLLSELGTDSEEPPCEPLSENVWHMRAECAARGGDYVKVAQRMATLAGSALLLENLRDEFDLRRGVAWLAFTLRGEESRWPAKIEERWIDPLILSRFAALLEAQDAGLRYICLDLGGQDCLIGCATDEQFSALRKVTGLAFEWLG
jgi:hypothetical protein